MGLDFSLKLPGTAVPGFHMPSLCDWVSGKLVV
jgi:hypothetical protein